MDSDGGEESVYIAKVEVSRPDDVTDKGMEGQCAVEDDTQTLKLRGDGDGGAVDGKREAVNLG